ncbi:hypothetical protein RFI_18614 [Reticulomyxa filosa]|uniref:Uncharacterized protein n=1 Tax=Reticulomyxa filosa TaxID=46433 RepID=X6MYD8_RETFI|nr:hypothetical protein RFI_18614 [Reticulomyxa filosa]|eukprot:ETO18648.1 hypothetical protein RFI_18614 [Reticulomyxa filosa]
MIIINRIILKLSNVTNQTIFQICMDYWESLARDLHSTIPRINAKKFFSIDNNNNSSNNNNSNNEDPWSRSASVDAQDYNKKHASPKINNFEVNHPRYRLYAPALHNLKFVLMHRIPRPKEVLVVQDDLGNALKEELKDTFALSLHNQISKTLWHLANIDPADSRDTILVLLTQMENNLHDIRFDQLQSLCWSIGAVTGSMSESDEKTFVVMVIKS